MTELDVYRILKQLRSERERLDHVIRVVEALSNGKRPSGRPPKFMASSRKSSGHRKVRAPK